ncbi:hypothetical protein BH23PLA1_BH23PLA1_15410 [soil metagenome]
MAMGQERDPRLDILNTLLTTPHRDLGQLWPIHQEMARQDPRFYVRLAAWYNDHGDVRDHKEMFVVGLALSTFEGHRDVGLALLRELPPYEVARVLDFVHGRKTTRKAGSVAVAPKATGRKARSKAKAKAKAKAATVPAGNGKVVESFGLFRNPPNSLRTEIARYLREREADPDRFDGAVLVARKAIKRMYALLHVKPGERAQQILFDDNPPPDSRAFALRALARADSPAEQARVIVEHRIPYRVAASAVRQLTPTVLLALIDRMSPQELINNLAALKKRGALDNPDLKSLIEAKLEQAKTSKRVSAFKAGEAVKAAGLSADLRAKVEDVADAQVKAKGRIKRPTALLIDKSSSMTTAIELGKRIGALISAVCEAELYVYAFDNMAYPIERAGDDLASWEKALEGIHANGWTSCGVGIDALRRKRQYVEQIVMITDEGENTPPMFADALKAYRDEVKADPNVCFVRTPGASNALEDRCRAAGIPADAFQFNGDYYSLPNLVPLLARPSRLELLLEIMEYPLPTRKPV